MHVDIRPIESSDHQQLIDLWLKCGLARSWNNPEKDIQRKLHVQPELLLGAFQGDQLVGSIMAGYDGHRGWMNYLGVLPNFQRQGIGKKLVEAAENGLTKLGCPKVNLQLRCSNFAAQHFYRKIGYGEDAALSFGKRLEFDSIESRDQGGSGTGGLVIRNILKPGTNANSFWIADKNDGADADCDVCLLVSFLVADLEAGAHPIVGLSLCAKTVAISCHDAGVLGKIDVTWCWSQPADANHSLGLYRYWPSL